MTNLKISSKDWEVVRFKLTRKYNTLRSEDLAYVEGQEEELIARLAKRIRRNTDYVRFTLGKELQDLNSNRL
ncbi:MULTISPECIES: hypothetical protein [Sphingobacterium]|uniref:General stress protein CsbD n=1 Tax=Sphingobacterium populi TaxID=1812824 RepID=A0ABW5UBD7_9SPHI|nr:hypothetical protein [Sphingobacterium sp. CFCC 11742]